ncbi:pentatricopeptide repeat-containing protein At2g13600-like [Mercurialis annua]|uniref:pentatricopeptide repeat-containing protein At2g13600-like n=1 Tax=Mercurialis annua TaxID=3986 RepID=UPI00215F83DF|nr:pentatricopeptide repeat-containing protein At2g13600-like [Mercurialis annua]XP_050210817.1 pentatricopeptide repeat-containing protein At2g13600-like [Mercurialis annua]XP_050210818.1 pentatricopeptide repeat-containing protein At2g13600-like [Mercurialis annua]XP_050210819.1 pentatricopeptide repeat-containing protein At2g13600-like [Mercurialis annua]XP_050210820.1 pentatricopeptide repeat-containing protein At2g13600-like [Mercurialis annua]XP_050210821.1 pentatricopeptide repeat-conta
MANTLKTLLSINPSTHFKAYAQTCVHLLKTFTNQTLINEGKAIHAHLFKMGVSSHRDIAIKLLIMYLNCRKSAEAKQISKQFNGFDLVVHNCLISADVQCGNLDEARKLFDEMPQRNEVSWTALISGFMKYGRVREAIWYFERNPFQNVVSWTAVISGYVRNGLSFEAMKLFRKLLESEITANKVTFTSVIKACANLGDFGLGMSVLGLVVKSGFEHDLAVSNSLITLCLRMGEISLARRVFDRIDRKDVVSWTAILDMYIEMDELEEAKRIFDEMPERNEVSWSVMIARYCQSGYPEESLRLFRCMVEEGYKPNLSCLSSILSALAGVEALRAGMNIHGHVIKTGVEKDIFISSSLIDLYCKCGETKDGRLVFDTILEKNVVSWNAMVGGYSLNGQMEEAYRLFEIIPLRNTVSWSAIIAGYLDLKQFDKVFEVFNEMLLLGEIPNKSTFSSLLCACASTASLEKGKNLHGKIVKLGIQRDVYVSTALTDMYSKSGNIVSAWKLFNKMSEKNEISWTVMIQGLAESGFAEDSLNLFEEMKNTSTFAPNEVMFLSVLFACSHAGFVDKGLQYFNSMEAIYGLKPKGKHYTCIVDMLSRAGRLSEAEEFIHSMPFQPETNAWAALISGCKTYKNDEIAVRAARKLCEREEKNSARYILLSNIYASAGRWVDVLEVRNLMKQKGLKKNVGCSWVEIRDKVHSFYSEDGAHSQSAEIYGILELLRYEMLVSKNCKFSDLKEMSKQHRYRAEGQHLFI